MNPGRSLRERGFTLIELLVVAATIGILAALLFPVLTKAKIRAHRAQCENNLKQLTLSWIMYYQENNGRLTESYGSANPYAWVQGSMKDPSEAGSTDLVKQGKLFQYNHDTSVYHCPTDRGTVAGATKSVATVRSYSMNGFMGGRDPQLGGATPIPPSPAGYVPFFEKDSDLKRVSDLWVFIDEDERSIDDGFFVIDPTAQRWYDFPPNSASRHMFSYCLSFADGHCDYWRIRDPQGKEVSLNTSELVHSVDLDRLASTCTIPK